MGVYYNEIDEYCAQWLRNLMNAGVIASGEIDTRSIEDVSPQDLKRFDQCHFFAGIGIWSYALRLAGIPDSQNSWTGSCPCQPFSAAGKGAGFADERHLWPSFHWLINECQPDEVYGEQVASGDGLVWLDLVQPDLEGSGYAVGVGDLCAAGFGSPQIRQRLYWYAKRMADADGWDTGAEREQRSGQHGQQSQDGGIGGMDDTNDKPATNAIPTGRQFNGTPSDAGRPGPTHGFWRDVDWIGCRDGKWRPVEPGIFPLAHGVAGRVGRLRAYGNAIVAEQAAAFIQAAQGFRP